MGQTSQTSFLDALRRFPWTLVVFVPIFVFVGLSFERAAPAVYSATSTLIVEDPRASTLFEITEVGRPSSQSSERYLADQVAIIESTVTADMARSFIDEDMTVSAIRENTTVTGDAVGNVIEIEAEASSAESARVLADALALAYMEVQRTAVSDKAASALREIDSLLSAVDTQISDVNRRISQALANDAARAELRDQFDEATLTLNQLRELRDEAEPGSEARAELNAQIDELLRDFQVWAVILETEVGDPELEALATEQETLVNERASLIARRNSVTVAAEVVADGVTLFSPAEVPDDPSGLRALVIAAAMGVLGVVSATSTSFWLAERWKVIDDRTLAESVLDAPLLAEIPKLDGTTLSGEYPVVGTPATREARSFRLAASALDVRATEQESRTILVVGTSRREIQSAVVANLAVSGAMNGLDSMLVDADSRTQTLTHHVFGQVGGGAGLTDVLAGTTPLEEVVGTIEITGSRDVEVIPLGQSTPDSSAVLRNERSIRVFETLVKGKDLVLIDMPSLLDSPFAGVFAQYSDALLVLVDKGVRATDFEQIVERLDLIDTPILGYLYLHGSRRSLVSGIRDMWERLSIRPVGDAVPPAADDSLDGEDATESDELTQRA